MFGREITTPWRLTTRPTFFAGLAFCSALLATATVARPADSDETTRPPVLEPTPEPRLDFRFEPPRATIGIRGGWSFNRAEGEIYDFLTSELTLEKSDFSGPSVIFDFSGRMTSWLDAVFGIGYVGSTRESEDRNFVDGFGLPILQSTRLTQVPVLFSLKLYPIGRGEQIGGYAWIRKRVVPYLGGGIGATYYELKQEGDFVDKGDPNVMGDETIFTDVFVSDGWGFSQHVFLGLDVKLTRNLGLILEGRYDWAKADIKGSFVGFDPIDLNGAKLLIGVNWKL
jgi:opacity protein-like surface antigen